MKHVKTITAMRPAKANVLEDILDALQSFVEDLLGFLEDLIPSK